MRSCSCCRSSTSGARSGCSTSTCSCCSASARRTCSSTAARSACRCRSSTRCCSTCSIRMLFAGLRPRGRPGRLVPHVPLGVARGRRSSSWSAFRVALNVVDSNVIDVGYAGVIGADRIVDGDQLYGDGFSEDVREGRHLRAGQLPALRAVRAGDALERALGRPARRPRGGDRVRPAHHRRPAAARPRPARRAARGRRWGWRSRTRGPPIPTRRSSLETNANDTLVALACALALLAFARRSAAATRDRGRPRGGRQVRPAGAGAAVRPAPAAACSRWRWRSTLAVTVLPVRPRRRPARALRPHGRLPGRPRVAVQRLGPEPTLDWLQTVVKVAAVGLALLVAFVPRRAGERQVAALGAAVLIALQLPVTHWFYLYVVWFVPFVLVAFGAIGPTGRHEQLADRRGAPVARRPRRAPRSATGPRRRLEADLRERQEALERELAA